jgi:hypothetical protein
MRAGARLEPRVALVEARAHAARQLACLPAALRSLTASAPFAAVVAGSVAQLAADADARTGERFEGVPA